MMLYLNFFMSIKDCLDSVSLSIYRLIELFQPLYKKNSLMYLDEVTDSTTELIDAYSLFQKSHERGIDSFYVMSSKHPAYKQYKEKYGKNILEYGKFFHIKNFFKLLKTSKFIVSFALQGKLKNFLYKNKYINLVFLGHGLTLLKDSISGLYNHTEFNKFLVSNDVEANLVKKLGKFREEDIIKVTMPRFDYLKDKQATSKKKIFVFFTWRMSFGTIDYKKSLYYKRLMSLLNNQHLKELLDNNNIELCTALHHCLLEKDSNFLIPSNIKVIKSTEISKMIKEADMLITDYSSIWGDFYFQNKPVIFYRLDEDDEILIDRDKNDIKFAAQSDNLLSNVVREEDKVIHLIEKYIAQDLRVNLQQKNAQDKFFYAKNNIREKILEELGV